MKRLLQLALILLIVGLAMPARAAMTPVAGCVANAATNCTWANFSGQTAAIGDWVYYFAFRTATTAPTAPTFQSASMTNIATASASSSSFRSGCAVLTSATPAAITAANATRIFVLIIHGTAATTTANCLSAGVGFHTAAGTSGTTSTYTFTGGTLTNTNGSSFIIGAVGSSAAPCTPTTLTVRSVNSSTDIFDNDSNGGVSSFSTVTCTGTTGNWKSDTLEILASPCNNTTISGGFVCRQTYSATSGSSPSANTISTAAASEALTSGSIIVVEAAQQTGSAVTFSFTDGGVGLSYVDGGKGQIQWHTSASTDQVFYALNTSAASSYALTLNSTITAPYTQLTWTEYTGNAASSPIDAFSGQAATTSGTGAGNITSTTGSPGVDGDLIVGFTDYISGPVTAGAGFTQRINSSAVIEDQVQASHASIAATFNDSTSGDAYVAFMLAIKKPAVAATCTPSLALLGVGCM